MAIGRVGIRQNVNLLLDSDAQAFITAAGLSSDTHKNAVNELVKDFKSAGLWTKMMAIYPFVGGTATSHKFNLKDPRDLDAAFRLTFSGSGVHSATGYNPNGVGYANTFFTPSSYFSVTNAQISYYSRTEETTSYKGDFGSEDTSGNMFRRLFLMAATQQTNASLNSDSIATYPSTTKGLLTIRRNTLNSFHFIVNSSYYNNSVNTTSLHVPPNRPITLGIVNGGQSGGRKECGIFTIGTAMTDTEYNLFYRIVEKYQVALGRSVNVALPFYYNNSYSLNTNLFFINAGITDPTQISAVGTLVNTLTTAGIWTKMKAVYPMVGGTSTSHAYNLVNPSLYNLTFVGGWSFSNSGSTPNGSTAYANTGIVPSSVLNSSSLHMSYYSRSTNPISNLTGLGIGCINAYPNPGQALYMHSWNSNTLGTGTNTMRNYISSTWQYGGGNLNLNLSSERGLIMGNRQSASGFNVSKNGVTQGSLSAASYLPVIQAITPQIYIGAVNNSGTAAYYSTYQCAFSSIGDGLTDAEALTFYNAVQAFQTTLGRQV